MRWTVVRRYIGNLAPALKDVYGDAAFAKLAEILGAADGYPELKAKPAFMSVGPQRRTISRTDPRTASAKMPIPANIHQPPGPAPSHLRGNHS